MCIQQNGLSVLVIEGSETVGGGMRTKELIAPDYWSDICSAIHPTAAGSPFFQSLPLEKFGLEWIHPPVLAAHPFDNGTAALLKHSIVETAAGLGANEKQYLKIFEPLLAKWPRLAGDVLGPLRFPKHPLDLAAFGLLAMQSGLSFSKKFATPEAKGLWAGMSAHSLLPLDKITTAAIGLVLMANGHLSGWPLPRGGSRSIASALAGYFQSIGGRIQTGWYVKKLKELPEAKAVLFDVTPKQLLDIAGESFSDFYKWQLKKYRYGPGVFKVDWSLDGPVPFTAPECLAAGTVHLGGTVGEIAASEADVHKGRLSENPFVLLAQQSLFDDSRAPIGHQVLWGYCHVPNGSTADRTATIERQIERFAPGFRDRIIGRHTYNTAKMETYNPNYVGGDINGGMLDIWQLYTRPTFRFPAYRTAVKGLYLCSASTPPGGGVHGMCGFHAANRALNDIWKVGIL